MSRTTNEASVVDGEGAEVAVEEEAVAEKEEDAMTSESVVVAASGGGVIDAEGVTSEVSGCGEDLVDDGAE